ncbi:hypothetical protein FD13_GL002067 [Levilactobacillus senmaizukei DSM 21775 = NBRC 103853]|uniref:DUF3021 domain-containing protein n=1 Tax=Levilactobacillus senmaizukei DSM 21775 = NBRC 103853 TaxID=1423803 RepID=A0A0R2DE42_9LACO|nr:DUF3021 family protein [Levilactobacillus senmaizukei]KRN02194.1 hypothetical protein FD13_GL002067 [Levilactobacillus senmaizukei DSM 21775 = NBRC 103853]
MNKMFIYGIRGMGYGAVTFFLLIAVHVAPAAVSTKNVLSLLLVSAAIGLLSMIFDDGHQEVAWPLAYGIHLIGTSILMLTLMVYNHWSLGPVALASFLFIYVIIWAVVMLNQHFRVTQINRAIKQRTRKKS